MKKYIFRVHVFAAAACGMPYSKSFTRTARSEIFDVFILIKIKIVSYRSAIRASARSRTQIENGSMPESIFAWVSECVCACAPNEELRRWKQAGNKTANKYIQKSVTRDNLSR